MRVRISALFLALLFALGGCRPTERCGGVLYFDPSFVSCRPCPKIATFKGGTCQCPSQYEFVDNRCVLMDGAVAPVADTGTASDDAGAGATAVSCRDYCAFTKECIGENSLATAVLSDIVAGLHANDSAACTSSCMGDLGGDGSSDPVVACVAAGRDAAQCAGLGTQDALTGALSLLGDCCRPHPSDALCKSICKTLKANALTANSVDFCK